MNKKLASFLLTEVSQWEKERIISSQQAQLLQQRYQAQATKHSQNLLQIILSVIGALLIGVGIVSILAFNWDNLPETLRVIIAFLPLVFSYLLMFYTIKNKASSTAWCEGAAIANTAGIFASLAMVSQVFHLSASLDNYFLLSAILILPTIYLLNSASPLLIYYGALLLWRFNFEQVFKLLALGQTQLASLLSLFLAALSLPFIIKRHQDKGRFGFAYINWSSVLLGFVFTADVLISVGKISPLISVLVLCTLAAAVAVAFRQQLPVRPFAFVGNITYIILFIIGYSRESYTWWLTENSQTIFFLTLGFLAIFMGAGLWLYKQPQKQNKVATGYYLLSLVGSTGLLSAMMAYDNLFKTDRTIYYRSDFTTPFGNYIWIIANLIIVALAILLFYRGIKEQTPSSSSMGLALICILVTLRFFDDDFSFLIKGLIFIAMGMVFLVANWRLSKYFKTINIKTNPLQLK